MTKWEFDFSGPEVEKLLLEIEKEKEKEEKYNENLVERIHNKYTKEKRINIIKEISKKYSSKKYINRELSLGYEPRTPLYWVAYEYAKVYGKECDESEYTDFVSFARIIDDSVIIKRLDGQGSVIDIFFL